MRLNLKLKSVKFENFRLFEQLEMDFHPKLTVLIGENGAGKTALVEGIVKLLSPIPEMLENPNKELKSQLFQQRAFAITDIQFGKPKTGNEIQVEFSIDRNPRLLTWEANTSRIEKYVYQFASSGMKGLIDFAREILAERYKGKNLSVPIIAYYPCEKVDNESQNGKTEAYQEQDIFSAYENALNARVFDFDSFFKWFKWQEEKELRGQGSKTMELARKAILAMLNDEGEEEKFTGIFVDVSAFGNPRLKLKKGEAELEVSQLSAGEKSLFALVSDIARRLAIANPDSEDPLKDGGGIVLIDEIDLHLHPRWQRKVVRKLTEIFPNLQFVVTTHSPLILGGVRSENIRLLDEGKVYSVPETLGQNVGVIIKRIMGVEESLFEEKIGSIFRHLAKNQIEEAKAEIADIEQNSPADIPALREAKAVLKRKEILAE